MNKATTFSKTPPLELALPRFLSAAPIGRFLVLIYALVAVLLGYGLLVTPEATLAVLRSGSFGDDPGAVGETTLRIAGAMLGGLGVTLLCLLPMAAPEVRRRIAVGLYVTTSILFFFYICVLQPAGTSAAVMVLTLGLFFVASGLAAALRVHGAAAGGPQQRWQDQIREAAAQQERNRLARDLHDSIKQQIFSIRVATATVEARWATDPEGAQEALAHARKSAQEAAVEMQALLHQLRPEPLANAGLVEALREQCEALGYRTGARVEVEIGELPSDKQLPPSAQEALFRVAQEALANVARHARATKVHVRLGRAAGEDRALVLEVSDDGRGFDPAQAAAGMGLRNMRDRLQPFGGSLEIESAAGSGARLTARLPLAGAPAAVRPQPEEARYREAVGTAVSMALAMAICAALVPMIPEPRMPGVTIVLGLAVFFGLYTLVMAWRWRSNAMDADTILPKSFVLCLLYWFAAGGWYESYLGDLPSLVQVGLGLLPLGLLALVTKDFWRRTRTSGPHIWLGILLLAFVASMPWLFLAGDPYAASSGLVIAASLYYMVWWIRERL